MSKAFPKGPLAGPFFFFLLGCAAPSRDDPDGWARHLGDTYVAAVRDINEAHAARPRARTEEDLSRLLPPGAAAAFEELLRMADSRAVQGALIGAALASADLDRMGDFERVRARVGEETIGTALSRPRFLLRGWGVGPAYLGKFAAVLDAVLDAYDRLFGFEEWSKVPGKKLRVRIVRVDEIRRLPHFDVAPPFHSEIFFPVLDAEEFVSPGPGGEMFLYGLAHELGHVISGWGGPGPQEDHHAWASYTGFAVVEQLSKEPPPFMKTVGDAEFRSLAVERARVGDFQPSLADYDGVMALLVRLHGTVGPRAIGAAINRLDRRRDRNRVRYARFEEFGRALPPEGAALVAAAAEDAARPRPAEVDLLALVDPEKDSIEGRWRREGGALRCVERRPWARIQVPFLPPDEYDVDLVVERVEGVEAVNVGLARSDVLFHAVLDGFANQGYRSGLSTIDGRWADRNETAVKGPLFTNGRPHRVSISVRKGGVSIAVDGRRIVDWKGDFARLGNIEPLAVPTPRALYLNAYDGVVRFHSMTLASITGRGRPLR